MTVKTGDYCVVFRYFRLYRAFFANCITRAMEFRGQFFAGIVSYCIWTGVTLIFIQAVFGKIEAVRGWSRADMWVLYGTFVILESICYGLLGPNMWRFSGTVRDGTLDLALTRPVDTQFLVSTRYVDLNGVFNAVPGFVLLLIGLRDQGYMPTAGQWLLWLILLVCGFIMAYSIWFFCVTGSIWAVKLESVAIVFDPMLQMARFPLEIYPRRLLAFLTLVLPVAFLTTFPAQALLGRAENWYLPGALALAAFMLLVARGFFHFALRFYGSASS